MNRRLPVRSIVSVALALAAALLVHTAVATQQSAQRRRSGPR